MTTLIIPCAGKSSRFPGTRPKWLLTHPDGNLMIQKSVQNIINLKFIKKKIIVITKEINEKFNAKFILKKAFNNSFEILILNNQTKSASETVFQAIKKKKINGPIIIKDSDCHLNIKKSKIKGLNFIGCVNLNKNTNIQNLHMKSFVKINKKNQITDIIEKKIVSENICVGLYAFSSEKLFFKAYFECKKIVKDFELYLSILVRYLINDNYLFNYMECTDYEDYGTFDDWLLIRDKYRTFFTDLDGVIFKNKGKYGRKNWYTHNEILTNNVKKLLQINDNGAEIIFCSARSKDQKKKLIVDLKNLGFRNFRLILGLNHTQRILINDFTTHSPNPTALAINLLRDKDDLNIYV